jgi:hypothetical protein
VDAAQPGDTILVKGRHRENVAIITDGITLRGLGAVLELAAAPVQNACPDPSASAEVNGVCILGDVNFGTGEVIRQVRDVTIRGFTIRFHLTGDRVRNNTKACAAGEDIPFPLSGVGVALLGATGVKIDGNLITRNVSSADTRFSGGDLRGVWRWS